MIELLCMLITSQRIQHCLILALFETLLLSHTSLAQTSQTIRQKVFDFDEEISPLPKTDRLVIDLSNYPPNPQQLDLINLPASIPGEQIKIVGNGVLSTTELLALTNFNPEQTIGKSRLRQIIHQINQAYRDRGYVTSGIFTAPQLQSNGKLLLVVTEGTIEQIKITGLNRLRENYIRNRVVRQQQPILNQGELEQELELLLFNRLIQDISATVTPGSKIGNSILEITVQRDDAFDLELSVDNLAPLSFGSLRRQIKVNHDNLFGFGDRFYAAYTNTDGRNSLDALSYSIPLNSRDGNISLSYGIGKLEVIAEPLDAFDVDLEFSSFQLALYQPLYQTPKQEFALGLAFSTISTEATVFDFPFPVSRGAEDNGELNVSALRFSQSYTRRGDKDLFNLVSEISVGVDLFDATDNARSPDSHFVLWRGQTNYQRLLTDDITFSLKSLFQLSDRPLVFLERTPRKLFTVGREEETFILRGYGQGFLPADNGFFASAELQANILELESLKSTLQLTPFIDFGTAGNEDGRRFREPTLVSLGLGLRLLVSDSFRARVDWGIPLIEEDFDDGSLQVDGITFNIEFRPL